MDHSISSTDSNGKQTWRSGNMLYPLPAVLVSCGNYNGDGDTSHSNLTPLAPCRQRGDPECRNAAQYPCR